LAGAADRVALATPIASFFMMPLYGEMQRVAMKPPAR
jgi:hypothetical protein